MEVRETYHGYVRTGNEAIKLFEACRLGMLPRVQRRLSEKERQQIRSGSIFVWDEREAGMRRWTDGKSWSASRVSGSFLTYREMEGKSGGFGTSRRSNGRTPEFSERVSDEDQGLDGKNDGYRYKPDGLMKQSYSLTTSAGHRLHLISYYSRPQAGGPDLPQPNSDPALRNIVPPPGLYPEPTPQDGHGAGVTAPTLTNTPNQTHSPPALPEPQGRPQSWGTPQSSHWTPSPSHTPPWMQTHTPSDYPVVSTPRPLPSQPTQLGSHLSYIQATCANESSLERLPGLSINWKQPSQVASAGSSPNVQQLQVQAAQAAAQVMENPRLATASARPLEHSLPAMDTTSPRLTPPPTRSASPPASTTPIFRTGVSALLNPLPSNIDAYRTNFTSSSSSSPRTIVPGVSSVSSVHESMNREDQRALRSLDKKFCS